MRTVNTQRYDIWDDEFRQTHITWGAVRTTAGDRTRSRRRNTGRSDMFWNIVFTVLTCPFLSACFA